MPRPSPGTSRLFFALILALAPIAAHAQAFQIESRTEAQLYSMRAYRDTTPSDPVLLPRRRLVEYLGLQGYELVTGQPLGFEASLRVFADFGLPQNEAAKIDGMKTADVDLMLANAYWRGEHLQMRLGRQTYTDVADMLAFDGAWVRYLTSIGLGAEAYGGLWVKGASMLASSVYQPDGIRESDLRRVALMQAAPYAALDDIEPVVGAKLVGLNVLNSGVSGSAGYRESWLSGKVDRQLATLDLRYGKGKGFNAMGGPEYDLLMSRVGNARAQVRFDASEFAVSAEFLHINPILSADSIFLYFATAARDEARLRADYFPAGPFRFWLAGVFDTRGTNINSTLGTYSVFTDPKLSSQVASPISAGGSGGGSARASTLRASADATYKTGFGGSELWIDVAGGWQPEINLFSLDARISYANISDDLNPALRGSFFGAQLWGSWFLTRSTRASVMLEENVNPFTRSDTKVFLIFDWKVTI